LFPNGGHARLRTESSVDKVIKIGGVFFRARDPAALGRWYETHLGVTPSPENDEESPWRQEAGPTVFAPFPERTDYFGDRKQRWMVNVRVRDLAAMTAQLRGAGVAVELDPEHYPNGRFARLEDPDGNPVELWEPQGSDPPRTPPSR
jgi:catechol 2,3-dioxygenase-like lactoylglutathione lyase family enzyme